MNKGTILTLSGLESRRLLDTFAEFSVPHIQVSYYYLKKVFAYPAEFEEYASKFETVFIDHGLIYEKVKSDDDRKQFIYDYASYVGGLSTDVYHAVVAHPLFPEWDSVVPSYSQLWSLEDLEEMYEGDTKSIFSQVEYVGLSNKVCKDEERMGYLSSQAKNSRTRLHAFGTSSIRVLKKFPFYSANSSSWRTGSRYANTYLYEGQVRGLRIYQPTDKSDLAKTDREKRVIRTRLKGMVEARQPDLVEKVDWPALIDEDDSWEVDKANLTQWKLYQRDLEFHTRNAYWLDESDLQALSLRKAALFPAPAIEGRDNTAPLIPRDSENEDNIGGPDNTALGTGPHIIEDFVEAEVVEDNTNPFLPSSPAPSPPPSKLLKEERTKELDARMTAPRTCDMCILAQRCPKYQAGATCFFGLTDSYMPADLDDHINEDVADLLAMQKDRVMQGYLEEKMDASGLNKDLSREVRLYLEMVALHKQSMNEQDSLEIKARGTGLMQMFNKKPGQ